MQLILRLRLKATTILVSLAMMMVSAYAGDQFVDKDGVANFGYDVVAYHVTFTPTVGSEKFQASFNDAVFYFSSAENRDLFESRPEDFIPAYDGHCAFALVNYKKLIVDPEAFSIVHPETGELVDQETYSLDFPGILYLNYSSDVNKKFNEDISGNVIKADIAWDGCLENKPAAKPKKSFRDLFGGRRPKDCPAL